MRMFQIFAFFLISKWGQLKKATGIEKRDHISDFPCKIKVGMGKMTERHFQLHFWLGPLGELGDYVAGKGQR